MPFSQQQIDEIKQIITDELAIVDWEAILTDLVNNKNTEDQQKTDQLIEQIEALAAIMQRLVAIQEAQVGESLTASQTGFVNGD